MRATVPFLAAGMAVAAAACGSPSSGSTNDKLVTTGGGQGGTMSADSGSSGSDSGTLPNPSFGGSNASGGANESGGTGGAGGATSGGGGNTANAGGAGGGTPGGCSVFVKDCNGDSSDGCETDTSSDPNNCGACGKVCPGAPNAAPSCFVGKCDIACNSGWGDCNTDNTDGCEQNLTNDSNNCGACGMVCTSGGCLNSACKCASTSVTAAKVPLDMYILFDQSGSMKDNVTGGTKWAVIKSALTTFVQSPGSAGMRVGIGYFPLTTSSSSGGTGGGGGFCIPFLTCGGTGSGSTSCNWQDYSSPDVGIDLLPGVATAIVNSLNAHGPGGNTPTYPALQGAYSYATIWATANPNRKTIVVLATDGDPNGCATPPNDVNDISTQLVAPALAQNPSLLTFVVGVGSSLTSLNQIAASGGTGQAFVVDTAGADPGAQFLAAMQAIEGSAALGCEYSIPSPPSGPPDYGKVNVQFTPPNGSPTLLKKVQDAASCTGATGGWHYDDNAAPTKIILCDSSCSAIQSFSGAKVEVELGCASVG